MLMKMILLVSEVLITGMGVHLSKWCPVNPGVGGDSIPLSFLTASHKTKWTITMTMISYHPHHHPIRHQLDGDHQVQKNRWQVVPYLCWTSQHHLRVGAIVSLKWSPQKPQKVKQKTQFVMCVRKGAD